MVPDIVRDGKQEDQLSERKVDNEVKWCRGWREQIHWKSKYNNKFV